jgi:hypothetical protein
LASLPAGGAGAAAGGSAAAPAGAKAEAPKGIVHLCLVCSFLNSCSSIAVFWFYTYDDLLLPVGQWLIEALLRRAWHIFL